MSHGLKWILEMLKVERTFEKEVPTEFFGEKSTNGIVGEKQSNASQLLDTQCDSPFF